MSTITALTSAPVRVSEITEQMLDELKAATTCNKWRSTTSKYLEVTPFCPSVMSTNPMSWSCASTDVAWSIVYVAAGTSMWSALYDA